MCYWALREVIWVRAQTQTVVTACIYLSEIESGCLGCVVGWGLRTACVLQPPSQLVGRCGVSNLCVRLHCCDLTFLDVTEVFLQDLTHDLACCDKCLDGNYRPLVARLGYVIGL